MRFPVAHVESSRARAGGARPHERTRRGKRRVGVPAFQELVERHQPLVVVGGFHELRFDDPRDVGRALSREAALR